MHPNLGAKTIKHLGGGEQTGINICDLGLGNYFLATKSKTLATKEIIDKLDVIKVKNC